MALWPVQHTALHARLPASVQERVALVAQWQAEGVWLDAVLHHGDRDALRTACQAIAARPGPIVSVTGLPAGSTAVPLERLVLERSLSVNTAAAGGQCQPDDHRLIPLQTRRPGDARPLQGVRHHLEFRIIRIGLDREPQIAHELEHLGVVGQHQPFDLGQALLARATSMMLASAASPGPCH